MARGSAGLVKAGLIGVGALYALGESQKHGGIAGLIQYWSDSITKGLGTAAGTVNPGSGGGTTSSGGGSGGGPVGPGGVFTGNRAQISIQARKAGVTSTADPNADLYGAALWSLQSGQPMSAFAQLPQATRATFDAVAINGS